MSAPVRQPRLDRLYRTYQHDGDAARFVDRVAARYTIATLERLAEAGSRMTRRASVLALGSLAGYKSNMVLGRRLSDSDRGVRLLAETAIQEIWCRDGSAEQQMWLRQVIRLNDNRQFASARAQATALIRQAASMAEAWNQRAIACFGQEAYESAIRDCRQTLELNPYHFGAAAGMGLCYLRRHAPHRALPCLRRALELNPNLEGIRARVAHLERA